MLALSSSCRYFLYGKGADMRCGIYALAGLVRNDLGQDPLSGDIFIFIGKRGNQIRLLQWEGDGFALYSKRLEEGTFQRPASANNQISDQQLMLILRGIQLESVRLRKRFQLANQAQKT